ncbi:LTA synthase family protein [Mollicutes bacterium LVI A0075]|nr:LTA synthase family protein [Mollicutes bacterium LVI A0075]
MAGVSESVTGYLNPMYILILIFPLVFAVATNKLINNIDKRFPNKVVLATLAVVVTMNIGFFYQDDLLYTTVYSPLDYAREFGFISFYAREITPFTKKSLDDVEYNNVAKNQSINSNTGIFEDKTNVVLVAAESFDDIAIDETLTPTLYMMSQDGLFFENYYTLSNNTNASEFSIMTSVHPPIDNAKVGNFSGDYNSIPELFNQEDFCTFAFHLNYSTFYNRGELYPELYDFDYTYFSEELYPDVALNDVKDELLFELSTRYIEEQDCEKNFSYYMSYYGHSAYHISTRPSAESDFEYVNSVYPENDEYLNAYLSFQMSLDKMAEEMIQYYDQQGILEDTVFIFVADHYPYALGDPEHQYGEYSQAYVDASFSGDAYEIYNVPFFIYDPTQKLDNNQEYMSNVDVLPTIADLFGLDYEYSEGKSAFDDSEDGVIKWLGVDNFGILSKDTVYPSEDPSPETLAEVEEDKLQAAKLYSLFD